MWLAAVIRDYEEGFADGLQICSTGRLQEQQFSLESFEISIEFFRQEISKFCADGNFHLDDSGSLWKNLGLSMRNTIDARRKRWSWCYEDATSPSQPWDEQRLVGENYQTRRSRMRKMSKL